MEELDIKKISQELEEVILQMQEQKEKDEAPVIQAEEGLHKEAENLPKKEKGQNGLAAGWRAVRAVEWKSLVRPGDGALAAFLIPVLAMVVIFIQRGIFPFGEQSFLRTDMYHQYAPFFSEFQYKLRHGGSLLYSWNVGLGINFAALFAYYLASPFNWLLILCPKKLIIEFMTYMIVLKIGLSGATMNYYLRRHYRTENFGTAFFGILYALSGYMAAYSWNIMWLDCIILFPVIMLGLERLVYERKWKLYCISLGLSILSNYYISIMICIFLVIDFGALLILEGRASWKERGAHIIRFSLASLGAGGLAGFLLVPEVLALRTTASGSSNFPKTFSSYFSVIDMIARHIGNVEVEIGLDHWPNIYCGVAVLLFFLMYLACRKIRVREKAVYCSLLLFFYLSFSVNVLNFLWHGFHYPNSLPCRQSFIYIFLLLSMCCHGYLNLKDIPWKHVVLAFFGSVCFVLIAEQTVTESDFHFIAYYAAILFLALYTGLLYLYHKGMNRGILTILALGLVSLEAAVNMAVTSVTITSRTSYVRDNEDVQDLLGIIPQDTFYRVEKMARKTKNDGAWMNFPSVSLFSSVANADLSKLFKEFGCESSTNAYSITGSTPLINSLLSVRYGLYSDIPEDSPLLTYMGESGSTYLYENAYTLPLGFMLPSFMEYEFRPESGIPAEVQNQFAGLLGCSPVLTDAWGEVNGQTFRFIPERDGDYYVYVMNKNIDEVTVDLPEESRKFDHVKRGFFLELGWCMAGQEISVSCTGNEIMDARAYRFDEDALRQIHERLQGGGLTVTSWQDTSIEGSIVAKEDGLMFTSIPYDEGWKILVDGREIQGRKVMEAFLGFDLSAGSHQVSMKYHPPGLDAGAVISLISLLWILFLSFKDRKKAEPVSSGFDEADPKGQDREEEALSGRRFGERSFLYDEDIEEYIAEHPLIRKETVSRRELMDRLESAAYHDSDGQEPLGRWEELSHSKTEEQADAPLEALAWHDVAGSREFEGQWVPGQIEESQIPEEPAWMESEKEPEEILLDEEEGPNDQVQPGPKEEGAHAGGKEVYWLDEDMDEDADWEKWILDDITIEEEIE